MRAFWDTSALIPLCVRQSTTPQLIELHRLHEVTVWWGTPIEIASALARLLRTKQLAVSEWNRARKLAEKLGQSWAMVQPSDGLRATAVDLVNRHDLRAADALQLAAGLAWCEASPSGRIFLTADEKLRNAALISGFEALPI